MQLLLIQTQVMKVDMESALLQMDQIMRANRLNFSLMAVMPMLLAVLSLFSLGSTSVGEFNVAPHSFFNTRQAHLNFIELFVNSLRLTVTQGTFAESRRHEVASCRGGKSFGRLAISKE